MENSKTVRVDGVTGEGLRLASILVVEDELLIRMIVSDGLREFGYDVIEAMNGDEAVEILNSGAAVDLVFSDVRMPGSLDGIGLLSLIKTAFSGLPVVITSGHLRPELALADGATQFLAKPYGVEQAIRLIEGELAKKR